MSKRGLEIFGTPIQPNQGEAFLKTHTTKTGGKKEPLYLKTLFPSVSLLDIDEQTRPILERVLDTRKR